MSAINEKLPCFLAGPTAVGKSAVAMELAAAIGGEIISVDSMQVYRGLDIGTAKPSADEMVRVRHHLVDILDLGESFDAAEFVRRASAAAAEIQSRGNVPIFCGGTGLYFQAYLYGLGPAPPADAALRAVIEASPLPELLAELERSDPETFQRIDRQNPRRIVRAIEVIRLTGKPFSAQRASWQNSVLPKPGKFIGLTRSPGQLHERIAGRVDEMFARGLVDETRKLMERGLAENPIALQALGYRQVVEHLQGARGLEETIELVKIRTRQYAKRQLTWFRGKMRLNWISAEGRDAQEVCEIIKKENAG